MYVFLNVVKFSDLTHWPPVRSSLPFSPFGVQQKPYTSERRRRELGSLSTPEIFMLSPQVDYPLEGPQEFLLYIFP